MVDKALLTFTAWFYIALAYLSGFFALIDAGLHRGLSRVGVPSDVQIFLILLVDVLLIGLVFRVFGGVIRVLLLAFLVLLVLHILTSAAGFGFARGL